MGALRPRDEAVLCAIADVLLAGGAVPVDVAGPLGRFLDDSGPAAARRFRWLLRAFEHGARVSRRLRPFTKLPRDERERYVRSWAEGPSPVKRLAFHAISALVAFAHASDPAVERALGYADPRARGLVSERKPG